MLNNTYLNVATMSRTCWRKLLRLSSTDLNSVRNFSNCCRSAFSSAVLAWIDVPLLKMFTVNGLSSGARRSSSLMASSIWRSLATVMPFSLTVTLTDGGIIFDGPFSSRFGALNYKSFIELMLQSKSTVINGWKTLHYFNGRHHIGWCFFRLLDKWTWLWQATRCTLVVTHTIEHVTLALF